MLEPTQFPQHIIQNFDQTPIIQIVKFLLEGLLQIRWWDKIFCENGSFLALLVLQLSKPEGCGRWEKKIISIKSPSMYRPLINQQSREIKSSNACTIKQVKQWNYINLYSLLWTAYKLRRWLIWSIGFLRSNSRSSNFTIFVCRFFWKCETWRLLVAKGRNTACIHQCKIKM